MKDNFLQFSIKTAILMSTHNIRFYGEIQKMISKLSSNTLCSSVKDHQLQAMRAMTKKFHQITFFFLDLGFRVCQDYFTYFEHSQLLGGAKRQIPETKNLNLACHHMITAAR